MKQQRFKQQLLDSSIACTGMVNRASAALRMQVYRNNVYSSLIAALAQRFATVELLVGAEYFRYLAIHYIQRKRPDSPVLQHYGRTFPEFIEAFDPGSAPVYLADMARLDWNYIEVANAADDTSIELSALAQWVAQPENLHYARVRFCAQTRVLCSHYPTYSIWYAHQQPDCASYLAKVDLKQPEAMLMTRPEWQVKVHQLSVSQGRFLWALVQGKTIAQAHHENPQVDLVAMLKLLIEEQALRALEVDSYE